jgi:hypothetical protein
MSQIRAAVPTIETLGRVGIRVGLGGSFVELDSEMLHPPMSVMIYAASIPPTVPMPVAELLDEVIQALRWAGFEVRVV